MKKQNVIYIRVLMVVLSIVILLAFINRSPRHSQHDSWLPSSFNPVGEGNMALYETLSDLKWPVERWREPLSRLSTYGADNVLVVTRSKIGASAMFSEQEISLLDDWVKKGNTLVLLGALSEWSDTRALMMNFGIIPPEKNDSVSEFLRSFQTEDKRKIQLQPGPGTIGTATMILPPTQPLPSILPAHAKILWQDGDAPFMVRMPYGAGHVVLGASDHLLSNAYLTQGDNLDIVLRLLTPHGEMPHHIFFEESHHGFSAIYAMARLLNNTGVRFAAMLTLLGGAGIFRHIACPLRASHSSAARHRPLDARVRRLHRRSLLSGPTCATTRSAISSPRRISKCCIGSICRQRRRTRSSRRGSKRPIRACRNGKNWRSDLIRMTMSRACRPADGSAWPGNSSK